MTTRAKNRTPNRLRRRLRAESLEDRRLLAAGDLDFTFGVDGKVVTDFGQIEFVQDAALQSDGKIVVAGWEVSEAGNRFLLARFNSNGSVDTGFGSGGVTRTEFGLNSNSQAWSVAIDDSGRIVAAGNAGRDFALARYLSDGSLDASFGIDGRVVTDLLGAEQFDVVFDVAIDGDKIVAAGRRSGTGSGSDYALARYNSDGRLDSTFGSGGVVVQDVGYDEYALALAIDHDGAIVVAGGTFEFTLARFTTDGSLDSSFGNGGVTVDSFPNYSSARPVALAINDEGQIVATGYADDGLALARYESNGELDADFGSGGTVVTDFDGTRDEGRDVVIDAKGNIVVAGQAFTRFVTGGGNFDFRVTRYRSDGQLDSFFGVNGTITTDFDSNSDWPEAVVIDGEGQITVVGSSVQGDLDIALARYDSALDAQTVSIDVKSGNDENRVNLNNDGVIPVAILTTPNFDAASVDASTVIFAKASAVHHRLEDVDGDGDLDLLLHFRVEDTNLDALYAQYLVDDENEDGVLDSTNAELEVTLEGLTLDDTLIQGSGDVDVFLRGKNLRDLLDGLFT